MIEYISLALNILIILYLIFKRKEKVKVTVVGNYLVYNPLGVIKDKISEGDWALGIEGDRYVIIKSTGDNSKTSRDVFLNNKKYPKT